MNKVILKGRLTKDPQQFNTKTDKVLAKFSIAVPRKFSKSEADFINCVAWEKIADFILKYFTKGQEILIVGRMETESYENKQGEKVNNLVAIVEDPYFCGNKQDNQQPKSDEKKDTTKNTETNVEDDFFL